MNLILMEIQKKIANELLELQAAEQAIYMAGGDISVTEYISILGRLSELSDLAEEIEGKCISINEHLRENMVKKIKEH